jgi:hypothetical protein
MNTANMEALDVEEAKQSTETNRNDGGLIGWLVLVAAASCMGILSTENYGLINNEFIKIFNSTENHVLYAG